MSKEEINKDPIIPSVSEKQRLTVATLLLSLFLLTLVFGVGVFLQKIWKSSNDFATTDVPAFSDLYKLEELLTRESVSVSRIYPISSVDRKNIDINLVLINEDNSLINILFSDLEKIIKDNEEKGILEKAKERQVILNEKIENLNGNIEKGEVYTNENEQLVSSIGSLILQVQQELFSLSKLIDKRVSANSEVLSDKNSSIKRILILVVVLGLIAVSLFGVFLGRKGINISHKSTEEHVEELAKLNEELNKSNKLLMQRDASMSEVNSRLRQQDSVRSEFVSIVAHQLRTPLAGIKWTLDMLVNGDIGKLNVEQNSMLLKVMDSNDRMIRFVNDLLSLSRIESGRLEYTFVPMNLQHVVESVLLDLYPISNKKQITINFRGKGVTLPKVMADKDKIRVVFQNLLENAVKYSPQGGRITIELRNRGSEILASFIDEGIGIPKDEQKNIFNRFYRAPSAVKAESEGSGLGLYLARNIVEGHGGKIWFESEVGNGTTFYFTIPVPKTTPV